MLNPTDIIIANKNIFVLGPPASGKTNFAKQLWEKNKTHVLLHTDAYINKEYSLINLISNSIKQKRNYILEGNLCYTIIQHLNTCNQPNIIIELQSTKEQITKIYKAQRNISLLETALNFHAIRKTRFESFLAANNFNLEYLKIKSQ